MTLVIQNIYRLYTKSKLPFSTHKEILIKNNSFYYYYDIQNTSGLLTFLARYLHKDKDAQRYK